MRNGDRWVAAALAVLVALVLLIPIALAVRLAPSGTTFAGFLLNPIDGYSYLAKMRQGYEGNWTFRLPYAAEPGPGAFLFAYYLMLGHVARILGASLLAVLHAARTLATVLMFLAIYRFLEEFVAERAARWVAYALCLVGAGWGWLGIPFGYVASDLSIPETTPFLSAYANAHFPLATATLLVAAVGILGNRSGGRYGWSVLFLAGAVMGIVLPFVLLPAAAVLGVGTLVLGAGERNAGALSVFRRRIVSLGAFLAGAAPWATYGVWLLKSRPELAAWNAQNLTPSPGVASYLLGFAPLWLLGAFAVIVHQGRGRAVQLLLSWACAQGALLYAPLALQRRLSLGLYVALAALAALGLAAIRRPVWRHWLTALALASSVPSNLLVIGVGLAGVARAEPLMVRSADESCALEWLAMNAPSGSLVLAGETAGNRIPAVANLRVLYGHPFETPNAQAELKLVQDLFSTTTDWAKAMAVLESRGVDFVYFGPEEKAIGPASWPERLVTACACGQVTIFQVRAP